jgi:hypothetical protein
LNPEFRNLLYRPFEWQSLRSSRASPQSPDHAASGPPTSFAVTAGDVFVAEVRDPNQIVLRRQSLVDASQAYFWTDEWQRGERKAQEDIGRERVSDSARQTRSSLI